MLWLITAITFCWVGLVLGISFMEAPLKFRAPGVTRVLGLGIGKLVFTALNRIELVFAGSLLLVLWYSEIEPIPSTFIIPLAILTIQTSWLLPVLVKRIDQIVAGIDPPKTKHHLVFIVFEVLKIGSLIISGIMINA